SARKRAHSRRRRRIRLATAVPSGVSVTPLYGSYSRNPRPTSFLAISLADTRETSSVSARSGTGTGPAWPSSTARATVIRYISSLSDVAPEAPVGRCWMSGSVSVVMPDSGGWERRLAHRSERLGSYVSRLVAHPSTHTVPPPPQPGSGVGVGASS